MNKQLILKLRHKLIPEFEAETGLTFAHKPEWIAWLEAKSVSDKRLKKAFPKSLSRSWGGKQVTRISNVKVHQEPAEQVDISNVKVVYPPVEQVDISNLKIVYPPVEQVKISGINVVTSPNQGRCNVDVEKLKEAYSVS